MDYTIGLKLLKYKKVIYKVFNKYKFKYSNLFYCILAILEGIFLKYLIIILKFQNRNQKKELVSKSTMIC